MKELRNCAIVLMEDCLLWSIFAFCINFYRSWFAVQAYKNACCVHIMAKSKNDIDIERATSWVTGLVRHLAESSKVGVLSIEWSTQENLFVMQIEGKGGKKASKLFEFSELALCPLEGAEQVAFEAQLARLMQFFKKR